MAQQDSPDDDADGYESRWDLEELRREYEELEQQIEAGEHPRYDEDGNPIWRDPEEVHQEIVEREGEEEYWDRRTLDVDFDELFAPAREQFVAAVQGTDSPTGPDGPQPATETPGVVMHVDEDVDALLSGEIDKEEFDRRLEERDDPRETGTVTRFPHEEETNE